MTDCLTEAQEQESGDSELRPLKLRAKTNLSFKSVPSGVSSEPRSEKEGLNLTEHRQEFRGNQTISNLSVREGRVEFFIKKRLNYLFIEAMFLLHTNFKTSKKVKINMIFMTQRLS